MGIFPLKPHLIDKLMRNLNVNQIEQYGTILHSCNNNKYKFSTI